MNRTEIKHKIKISYVLFIFLFIFAPPLIPHINFVLILFLYSSFMMLTKYKDRTLMVFRRSGVVLYIKIMMFTWIYIALIMFVGYMMDPVNITNYIKTWYRLFMIFPVMFFCISYIIIKSEEMGYGLKELIRGLIYAAFLQTLITVLMLLFPFVREIILKIIFFNTGDELSQNLWHLQRRYFAFSHNVLDTFGYGTGILAALPLFYGTLTGKYKYYLYSLVLLVVPLFNSRTGLVIYFIGFVCILPLILFKLKLKNLVKLISVILIVSIIFMIGYDYLLDSFPNTMIWVESGIDDLVGFFKGEQGNDSVSVITSSSKWLMPESIWIITGTGHNVYSASGYPHSDVGYVNDIWLVGLFGIVLLYLPMTTLFIKALLSTRNKVFKILTIFLALAFYTTNIKTIVLNYNVGTSIIFLILFYIIFKKNESNKMEILKGDN